jgi:hypothetical protein
MPEGAAPTGDRRPIPCRVAAVSGPATSVAITAFAARRYPEDREHVEVLAEVHNLGDAPVDVVLDIAADGLSVGKLPLTLAAGERRTEVLRDLDAARTRLVAVLSPGTGTDPAALGPAGDDRAHAIVPPLRPFRVALITEGTDLFLEAALLTLQDHIQLTGVGPAKVVGNPAVDEADLVIIDLGADPLPSPLPTRDLVIFDPARRPDSPSPISAIKELPRPFLTEQALGHPLLDGVVLKDVNLARGTHLATLPGDQVLLRSLGDPIAVLRRESGQDDSTGARTIIAFGFDPRQTDLPLRTAFPILVANLVTYFEQSRPGFVASVPVGAARPLAVAELGLVPDGLTSGRGRRPRAPGTASPTTTSRPRASPSTAASSASAPRARHLPRPRRRRRRRRHDRPARRQPGQRPRLRPPRPPRRTRAPRRRDRRRRPRPAARQRRPAVDPHPARPRRPHRPRVGHLPPPGDRMTSHPVLHMSEAPRC